MSRISYISLCLLLSSLALQAQEVIFTTHVPASKMGTEDVIQIRYEIQNAQNVQGFRLSPTNDFKVVGGPAQGETFSQMNGEVSISFSVTYAFQPRRLGKLQFPTAIAQVGRNKIQSNPVSIEVVNGSLARRQQARAQQPSWFDEEDPFEEIRRMQRAMLRQQREQMEQQRANRNNQNYGAKQPRESGLGAERSVSRQNLSDNIFIEVDVDKTKVTIGEQITASYKLYTRVPFKLDLTKLPDLNNFWSQDFDIPQPPKPKREIRNGVEYQTYLIKKTALFATRSGSLILDPAEGKGIAQIPKLRKVKRKHPFAELFEDDPFFNQAYNSLLMDDPAFNDGFFNAYEYENVDIHLKSKPLVITVNNPPVDEQPKAFKGAVGDFSLESKISAAEMTTDDVATLTLIIRGTGNIKLIDPPKLSLPSSVEMYDPIEEDTVTSRQNNRITGYKVIKYRFNPQASGKLKIPSLTFVYYNADAERYEIKHTPEYTLRVKPGKNKKAGEILPMDIHDIAAENAQLRRTTTTTLPEQVWYWGAYLVPTLAFIGLLGFKRKELNERKNVARFKNKRANKVALSRLARAEYHRKANEPTKFYEETSKAIWLYLSDKLNIPLSTLSKEMTGTLLRKREIAQEIIDEVFLITDECELALYAPDAGDFKMNQVYSDSLKIIGTLEEKLS